MSLEDRLFQVRRARCHEHLVRTLQSAELAERWCEAWEREAEQRGWPRSGDYWQHGQLWIDAQITMRRSPGVPAGRS
jgi:hypothetical protein